MNRREIATLAIVVLAVLLLSAVATILMPVWLTVLIVKPDISRKAHKRMTQAIMRRMVKGMMTG